MVHFVDWLDPRRRPDAPEVPQPPATGTAGKHRIIESWNGLSLK